MRTFTTVLIMFFVRMVLWFRYRITFKGLEHINPGTMNRPGGVIFIPNHPAVFIDPVIVALGATKKYPIRPMIVEYMYYLPGVNALMRFMKALPVPNFSVSSNSIKRRRTEQVFEEVIKGLREGDNFLLYPAGSTKSQAKEILGGASGFHRILSELPETNIVLVRIKGLWGSRFSRAFIGKAPPFFPTLKWGIKEIFKNLIFFTPRRRVIVEYIPAPVHFPRHGTRLEVNRYLENWYNLPDGLSKQEGEYPGDSLMLVPYSVWTKKKPVIERAAKPLDQLDLSDISPEIRTKVLNELSALTEIPVEKIKEEMSISSDLGLDSLDTADLSSFLHDEFELPPIPVTELTTVSKVLALASRKIEYKEDEEPFSVDLSKWKTPLSSGIAEFAAGKTIQEAFLNICSKNAHQMCMGDDRLGALTYGELKLRSIILANYIKKLPGESVGILLPASVGAFLCIMACELAGKVPVMINWTVGPRHLETVLELSKIKTVLSSWAFIDRLEGVEFNGLEDQMVMLEDIRRDITLTDKIKGKLLSKKSNEAILSSLNPKGASEDDTAVLLFTSGTENNPKGVPLTHKNILNNQRPVITEEKIQKNDVLFGILPPFHSFGFTVATLLPVLAGVRVAFYPKPTDGAKLADRFEKWGITIMCGAPTFIKSMMRMATPDQLKTMRLCVSGAEKAPPEMFEMVKKLSNGMVIEGYGITECSPVITMNRPDRKKKGVGQPLPGVELAIVHPETFERMKPNEQGLILARGDTIFNGYLNPGIEPPFHEMDGVRWYKTGDLGSLDEDNYLTISGRQKRFVKIGGEMVSLSAVEDGLLGIGHKKHWPISEEGPCLAVIAIEESGERTRLVLFTSFLLDLDEANKAIREAGFSNLVRLSQVNHVKEIPIMGTGKVNYRALEKLHT